MLAARVSRIASAGRAGRRVAGSDEFLHSLVARVCRKSPEQRRCGDTASARKRAPQPSGTRTLCTQALPRQGSGISIICALHHSSLLTTGSLPTSPLLAALERSRGAFTCSTPPSRRW
jgi:hypothetical protein